MPHIPCPFRQPESPQSAYNLKDAPNLLRARLPAFSEIYIISIGFLYRCEIPSPGKLCYNK